MDSRGYEDELINDKKKRKNLTSIKGKTVFIVGRFTNDCKTWVGQDHRYIACKTELEQHIRRKKGSIISTFTKEVDVVCWLLPFKETKIIQRARELDVPVMRYGPFLQMME